MGIEEEENRSRNASGGKEQKGQKSKKKLDKRNEKGIENMISELISEQMLYLLA